MQKFILISIACLFLLKGIAQNDFKPEDFRISGAASKTGDNCFQLVPDEQWVSGSIWHKQALDFTLPFEMELKIMMGCNDRWGADGIVLAFVPYMARTGYTGEGMGFRGLPHSLGIELDTYYNAHLDDLEADHIAIMANGYLHHSSGLAGPVAVPNIEDCRFHVLKIIWSPTSKQIEVYLDGKMKLSYKGDVVKDIFMGDSKIYWGITAATGRYTNRHEFCVEKIENKVITVSEKDFDITTRRNLTQGQIVSLKGVEFNSGSSNFSDNSTDELERLYRFMKENPKHSISISGHTDSSGNSSNNKFISEQRAKAVADYLKKRGIANDRIKYAGYGGKYPVASNQTEIGRKQNRRVDIYVYIPQA
jgi:outer membrane protein OmpA-like peptidoglycan-associated protein